MNKNKKMKCKLIDDRWTSRNFLQGKIIDDTMFGDEPFDANYVPPIIEPAELPDEPKVKGAHKIGGKRRVVRAREPDSSDEEIPDAEPVIAPAPRPIDFWAAIAAVGWRNVDEELDIARCARNLADYRGIIETSYEEKLGPLIAIVERLEPRNARQNASHFLALGRDFYENALSGMIDDILVAFIHAGNCEDFDSVMRGRDH